MGFSENPKYFNVLKALLRDFKELKGFRDFKAY